MVTNSDFPAGFGIPLFDEQGNPVPPDEYAKIVAADQARAARKAAEENPQPFTPADILEKTREQLKGLVEGKGLPTFEDGEFKQSNTTAIERIADRFGGFLGTISIVLLGIIFIVLALVITDAGKKIASAAITKVPA